MKTFKQFLDEKVQEKEFKGSPQERLDAAKAHLTSLGYSPAKGADPSLYHHPSKPPVSLSHNKYSTVLNWEE